MAEEEKINLVLIDDHQLFRKGVKRILEMENELEVVAEGEDGVEATKLVSQHQPDVVLLNINMPRVNGVEATRNLVTQFPEVKVLILSNHEDESYVTHVLKIGAAGYLLQEMEAHTGMGHSCLVTQVPPTGNIECRAASLLKSVGRYSIIGA